MGRDPQLRELWTYLKVPHSDPENVGLFSDINYVLTDWYYTDHPSPFPQWFVPEFENVARGHRGFSREMLDQVCRTASLLRSMAPCLTDLLEELWSRRNQLSCDARSYLLEARNES